MSYAFILKGLTDDDDKEKALFGTSQFKGRCRICGKWGHKGADCRGKGNDSEKASGDSKKFTGTCHYCKKPGHMKANCFKKKKDESDQANIATDSKPKAKAKVKDDQADIVLFSIKEATEEIS